jgi:hypothetical protein
VVALSETPMKTEISGFFSSAERTAAVTEAGVGDRPDIVYLA